MLSISMTVQKGILYGNRDSEVILNSNMCRLFLLPTGPSEPLCTKCLSFVWARLERENMGGESTVIEFWHIERWCELFHARGVKLPQLCNLHQAIYYILPFEFRMRY